MLKKTFLALGLATLLAIPVGVALAADFPADVAEVGQPGGDQDQIRTQIRDPEVCGTCQAGYSDEVSVTERVVAQDRVQDQSRERDRDCDSGDLDQERTEAREQVREQSHMQEEQPRVQNGDDSGSGLQGSGAGGEFAHRNGADS